MSERSSQGSEAALAAERAGLEERLGKSMARLFYETADPQARSEKIYKDIKPLLAVMQDQKVADCIRAEIEQTCAITDQETFVATLIAKLRPFLQEYLQAPVHFEEVAREHWRRENNFTSLSKNLVYEKSEDIVRLHLASSRSMDPAEQLRSVREGLSKLAEVVSKDESITTVEATAWIVAARPGLLEKLGFSVEAHNLGSEELREHFPDENRPVRRATMTREVLLERYLKE